MTSITVKFGVAYQYFSHCRVTAWVTTAALGYTTSLTSFTVTGTNIAGVIFDYDCDGQ